MSSELAAFTTNPIVCILGAGFDLLPLRLERAAHDISWVEVDLPHVVAQKRLLLQRLSDRRPQLASQIHSIQLISANLTDSSERAAALAAALRPHEAAHRVSHVIFVIEALMIYMPSEAAASLLSAAVDAAVAAGATSVSICFADRLPGVSDASFEEARDVLRQANLELDESSWLPKPGLARHMGRARWVRASSA